MFTHVAKCTNNFIKIPSSQGPIEVCLPVVIAKRDVLSLFAVTNSLPDIPEKIKNIELSAKIISSKVTEGLVIIEIEFTEDVFYVYEDLVRHISFSEIFSNSICIPEAKPGMKVKCNIEPCLTYEVLGTDIIKKIIADIHIELIECRNIHI